MIDKLFGYPVAIGLKRRVAIKYFNRYWMHKCHKDKAIKKQYLDFLNLFSDVKVGDSVNTCSGLNGRIKVIYPQYRTVTPNGGQILVDLDLSTSVGDCSFRYCGVEPPKTKSEMEASIARYLAHPQAKQWNWDVRYSPEVCKISDNGTVDIDWDIYLKIVDEREKK